MDVTVTTSDPANCATAKDIAVKLVDGREGRPIYYVASVTVIDRETGDVFDQWKG